MDVYKDIVEWSKTQPGWVQDAIRRIVENGNFTESDVQEAVQLCKKEAGLETDSKVVSEPVTTKHVPSEGDKSKPTIIVGMDGFINVNRIAKDSALKVAPGGLTVVYGDNGAGKSGYARVLKKSCRARGAHAEELLPNVYEFVDHIPTATISYRSGDEAGSYLWQEDAETDDALSLVNIFDSSSARVHISDKNKLAYQPFGLDLMDKLATSMEAVADVLRVESDSLARTMDPFQDFKGTTTSGRFIASLNANTTEEDVTQNTQYTEADIAALKKAEELLASVKSSDPRKELLLMQSKKALLESLITHLDKVTSDLSGVQLTAQVVHRSRFKTTKEAAQKATTKFDELPVEGAGGELWKSLWEAARNYSVGKAYPDKVFPNTDDKCLLCHQDLGPEARERLQNFEAFVQESLQERLKEIEGETERRVRLYKSYDVWDRTALALSYLDEHNEELSAEIRKYLSFYEVVGNTCLCALEQDISLVKMDKPDLPTHLVKGQIEKIDEDIKGLKKRIEGEVTEATVQVQVDELKDKKLVSESKQRIEGQIERHKKIALYENSKKSASTRQVTLKSKSLSAVVTDELQDLFLQEIKLLDVEGNIDVALEVVESAKGITYHQIKSPSQQVTRVPITAVLSEGEQRAVALAAFMTEVTFPEADTGSAIVFDDPVSSLDLSRKKAIAHRLAKEAVRRQVIVFTHDLPFLYYLKKFGVLEGSTLTYNEIRSLKGLSTSGNIKDGLPWIAMSHKDQVSHLNTLIDEATASFKAGEDEEYSNKVFKIYELLREAWETGVEEVLLDDSVERFDKGVHTQRLKSLVDDVTEEDVKVVDHEMEVTCGPFVHKAPKTDPPTIPVPDKVREDIAKLKGWGSTIRKRREEKKADKKKADKS